MPSGYILGPGLWSLYVCMPVHYLCDFRIPIGIVPLGAEKVRGSRLAAWEYDAFNWCGGIGLSSPVQR